MRGSWRVFTALFCIALVSVLEAQEGRRVALVIGNAAYAVSPLSTSVNDARDVAAALQRLGYFVLLKENLTKRTMSEALDEFYGLALGADLAIFYFSGHGAQAPGPQGNENYLLPIDITPSGGTPTESDVLYDGVPLGRIANELQNARTKSIVFIIDACRSIAINRQGKAGIDGLAAQHVPIGSAFLFATQEGAVALTGTGRNSIYTTALLCYLEIPGVSLGEMAGDVATAVYKATTGQQIPSIVNNLIGNLYLVAVRNSLSDEWSGFVDGRILKVSIGTDHVGETQESMIVALCDDTGKLVVLKEIYGKWIQVLSVPAPLARINTLLADIDSDGLNEIIFGSDHVYIFHYVSGSYSLAWTSPEEYEMVPEIAVSDLDGNRYCELVVLNYKDETPDRNDTKSLYLYKSETLSISGFKLYYSTIFTDEYGYHSTGALTIADFNRDGSPEIVVGNDNGFLWLLSRTDSGYDVKARWNFPLIGAIGHALLSSDVNADGFPELIVSSNYDYLFVFNINIDLILYTKAYVYAGSFPRSIASADVDNDGVNEIIVGRGEYGYSTKNWEFVAVDIWKMIDGGFVHTYLFHPKTKSVPIVEPYDIDSDGIVELIIANLVNGGLEFYQIP